MRIALAFLTPFAWVPFGGWTLMLAVGVVHHEWWPAVPTIGYWWAVVLCLLLPAFPRAHLTLPETLAGAEPDADTVLDDWSEEDELESWLHEDDAARRRADA